MKKVQHRKRPAAAVKLAASAAGLAVCVTCFCSVTWAYFTYNIESQPVTLKSAYFKLSIEAKDESGSNVQAVSANPDTYSIASKQKVTFTLTPGESTATKGYAHIAAYTEGSENPDEWDTEYLTGEFTFTAEGYSKIVITAVWGEKDEKATILGNGKPITPNGFDSYVDEKDETGDDGLWEDAEDAPDEILQSAPAAASEEDLDNSSEDEQPADTNGEAETSEETETSESTEAPLSLENEGAEEETVTEESGE
jgi:hypothetical protein